MGLGKLIEVEKERADRQSLLRWTMVGASDTREHTSHCGRKNENDERKESFTGNCKKKPEKRTRRKTKRKAMAKIDSSFATLTSD
jgi:hypothetical protein